MTPLSCTLVPKSVLVSVASAGLGLRTKTPVVGFHSRAAFVTGVDPGTGRIGPTNVCRARNTPPSRSMLSSLR